MSDHLKRLRGRREVASGDSDAITVFARDIRALIADYDEMREALERIGDESNYGPDGGWDAKSYPDEIARAVLAKAGGK